MEAILQLKITQDGLDMEMKEHILFDKKFAIFIPSDFIQMDIKHIKRKYPNELRPL